MGRKQSRNYIPKLQIVSNRDGRTSPTLEKLCCGRSGSGGGALQSRSCLEELVDTSAKPRSKVSLSAIVLWRTRLVTRSSTVPTSPLSSFRCCLPLYCDLSLTIADVWTTIQAYLVLVAVVNYCQRPCIYLLFLQFALKSKFLWSAQSQDACTMRYVMYSYMITVPPL